MKRLFLSAAIASLAVLGMHSETITIGGTAYSATRVTDKQLAPGVQYINLSIPNKGTYGANVFITIADLSRSDVHVETINANGTSTGTATLKSMADKMTSTGHKVVAGANGNFWITSETPWKKQLSLTAWGTNVINGVMVTEPNKYNDQHCGGPTRTGAITVDPNGTLNIGRLTDFEFWTSNSRLNHTMEVHQCNRIVRPGEICMYNQYWPSTKAFKPVDVTDSNWPIISGISTEVLLDFAPGQSWKVGGDTKFIVKAVRTNAGTGTRGSHDLALVGRDSYGTVLAMYQVGDEVTVKSRYVYENGSQPIVEQALSGNIIAMTNGVINTAQLSSEAYNTNLYGRTLYATDATKKKLYILVCENISKTVSGLTTAQLCDVAKHFGATDAAQVDGGGSSQMYADGAQVSRSTDSSRIRAVHNGWFVVSTATETNTDPTPNPDPDPVTPSSDDLVNVYPDYAKNAGIGAKSSYNLNQIYVDKAISQLANKTIRRVIARGNYVYILALDASNNPTVVVFDHVSGNVLRTLGTANCITYATTTAKLNDIAMTADGFLVGMGTSTQVFQRDGVALLYKWQNDANGIPTGEASVWNISNLGGNWSNGITGDTFTFNGTTTSGRAYYTGRTTASSGNTRMVILEMNSNSQIGGHYYNKGPGGDEPTIANFGSLTISPSPFSTDRYICNGTLKYPTEYQYTKKDAANVTLKATQNAVVPQAANQTGIFRHGGKIYMVVPKVSGSNTTGVDLVNITNGLGSSAIVSTTNTTTSAVALAGSATVGATQLVTNSSGTVTDAYLVLLQVRGNGLISKFSEEVVKSPTITAGKKVAIQSVVGMSNATDLNVTGTDLSSDITVTVSSNDTGYFDIDTSSIRQINGSASGSIHIIYEPREVGTHTAKFKLKSTGATTITVTVTGTAIESMPDVTPVDASRINTDWIFSTNVGNIDQATWVDFNTTAAAGFTIGIAATTEQLYVLTSKVDVATPTVSFHSTFDGNKLGNISVDGITGGENKLAAIAILGGKLIGCNAARTSDHLKVYRWDSDASNPQLWFEYTGHDLAIGDILTTYGNMTNGKVAVSDGRKAYVFTVTNGNVNTTPQIIPFTTSAGAAVTLGDQKGKCGLAFLPDGSFWANGKDQQPAHFSAEGVRLGQLTETTTGAKVHGSDIDVFQFAGRTYMASIGYLAKTYSSLSEGVVSLNDVTDGYSTSTASNVSILPSDGFGETRNTQFVSNVTVVPTEDNRGFSIYALVPRQGVAKFSYADATSGIEDIMIDTPEYDTPDNIANDNDSDAPVIFYNMRGMQVPADNLTPGLYIRRQGSKATKVLVR